MTGIFRFGPYSLDPRAGELQKGGLRIALESQPAEVLLLLIASRGQVVTREELRDRLWPGNTVMDPDDALNTAIRKIRAALRDSTDKPRYVETLPKRGYRFIAAVEEVLPLPAPEPPPPLPPPPAHRRRLALPALGLLAAAGLTAGIWLVRPLPPPTILRYTQLTHDGKPKFGPLLTDGVRLYFSGGEGVLQLSVNGGTVAPAVTGWMPLAIAPAGDELLAFPGESVTGAELPISALQLPAMVPMPLGIEGHAAAWSPDGKRILYANGTGLYLARKGATGGQLLTRAPGAIESLHWSPDGGTIRATVVQGDTPHLWQVSGEGRDSHFLGSGADTDSLSGAWTFDGRYFVFDRSDDIWAERGPDHYRLTSGPISFAAPTPSRDGKKLFAVGTTRRGELMRFDPPTGHFVLYRAGLSGDNLAFSPDGRFVAWTSIPEHALWRSRLDGSERVELAPGDLHAGMPRWSPDGGSIAFAGTPAGQSNGVRIYRVPSSGGAARALISGNFDQANPNWSPDGASLIFGGAPWLRRFVAGSSAIRRLDLGTGATSAIPGGEDLWAPKLSPDGRFVLAETLDSQELKIYDNRTARWTSLVRLDRTIGFPCWSHDGSAIYFNVGQSRSKSSAIYRVMPADRQLQLITELHEFRLGGSIWEWFGLAPDDSLLILRDTSIQEIYALEVSFP